MKVRELIRQSFEKVLKVNVYGTFVVNACVADGINSQYPDEGPFAPRAVEERGILINIASAVAHPVPARCLTYGPSKCELDSRQIGIRGLIQQLRSWASPLECPTS